MFRLSSPAPLALPKITSSTAAPSSRGLRSSRAVITYEARSSGRTPARAPLNRPNGVRTASYRYAAAHSTLEPYISPSGSAMSSMRAPSGSRK